MKKTSDINLKKKKNSLTPEENKKINKWRRNCGVLSVFKGLKDKQQLILAINLEKYFNEFKNGDTLHYFCIFAQIIRKLLISVEEDIDFDVICDIMYKEGEPLKKAMCNDLFDVDAENRLIKNSVEKYLDTSKGEVLKELLDAPITFGNHRGFGSV